MRIFTTLANVAAVVVAVAVVTVAAVIVFVVVVGDVAPVAAVVVRVGIVLVDDNVVPTGPPSSTSPGTPNLPFPNFSPPIINVDGFIHGSPEYACTFVYAGPEFKIICIMT